MTPVTAAEAEDSVALPRARPKRKFCIIGVVYLNTTRGESRSRFIAISAARRFVVPTSINASTGPLSETRSTSAAMSDAANYAPRATRSRASGTGAVPSRAIRRPTSPAKRLRARRPDGGERVRRLRLFALAAGINGAIGDLVRMGY